MCFIVFRAGKDKATTIYSLCSYGILASFGKSWRLVTKYLKDFWEVEHGVELPAFYCYSFRRKWKLSWITYFMNLFLETPAE